MSISWVGPLTRRHMLPAVTAMSVAMVLVPTWFSRTVPIEFMSVRLKATQVYQGDKLELVYSYRIRKDCESELHLAMYDNTELVRSTGLALAESAVAPEDNGPEIYSGITKFIGVPVHASVGTGSLQGQAIFHCNLIHAVWPIVVNLPSQEFTILEKKLAPALEDKVQELEKKLEGLPAIDPPFRNHPITPIPQTPTPPIGVQRNKSDTETVTPPIIKRRGPTRVVRKTKPKTKAENRTSTSAAATDSQFNFDISKSTPTPTSKIPPMPKEELPRWIKWLANQ